MPGINDDLLKQLVAFVQSLREQDIRKQPSISETVDWARTVLLMHADSLDTQLVTSTLNVLLKHESDIDSVAKDLPALTRKAVETQGDTSRQAGFPDL